MSKIRQALAETSHRPWPMPRRPWAMKMVWRELLFAHWEVPVEAMRAAVPSELPLDLFGGKAYLGVVPFRMTGIRGRFVPPVPGHHGFPELNVRTYVTMDTGAGPRGGVYFFSLDATDRLAIAMARRTFGLNYLYSRLTCERTGDRVEYSCERDDPRGPAAGLRCVYQATGPEFHAEPGTLEHWLSERYSLYTVSKRGVVRMGEIQHVPWPLRPATCEIESIDMTRLCGYELAGPPMSVLMADRIDVPAWLPTRVRGHG